VTELSNLINQFKESVANLDCETSEQILNTLRLRKDTRNDGYKYLGFKSWSQATRKVCELLPRSRRNKEKVVNYLVSKGFQKDNIYLPKVILNADEVDIYDSDRGVVVKCIKAGYSDFVLLFENKLVYVFNKVNDVELSS